MANLCDCQVYEVCRICQPERYDEIRAERDKILSNIEKSTFDITIDEAKALNYLLKLHNGLLKQSEEQYVQILRLINGLGTFLDQHDIR